MGGGADAAAVVTHGEAGGGNGDGDVAGTGVPNDVRGSFAQRPGEDSIGGGGQLASMNKCINGGGDVGGFEGLGRGGEFGVKGGGAQSGDGGSDLGEGVATELGDVRDFGGGARGVELEEFCCEFGFKVDDGQRVAEDVVDITGNAFAFRGDGSCCSMTWWRSLSSVP